MNDLSKIGRVDAPIPAYPDSRHTSRVNPAHERSPGYLQARCCFFRRQKLGFHDGLPFANDLVHRTQVKVERQKSRV